MDGTTIENLIPNGSFFLGSLNNALFDIHYETWQEQLVYSTLLQPTVHWLDAGMFSPYVLRHVHEHSEHGTSWFEKALTLGCVVPRMRDKCNSSRDVLFVDVLKQLRAGGFSVAGYRGKLEDHAKRLDDWSSHKVKWSVEQGHYVGFSKRLQGHLDSFLNSTVIPDELAAADDKPGMLIPLWDLVKDKGKPAFNRSLERTRRADEAGFTLSHFAYEMHKELLGDYPSETAVDFALVLKKLLRGNDYSELSKGDRNNYDLARQLFRLFCEKWTENFAALTVGRRYSLLLSPEIRLLTLGHVPTWSEEYDAERQGLCEIELPSAEDLLRANPVTLKKIRADGHDYFRNLINWRADPTNDSLVRMARALTSYAGLICDRVRVKDDRPMRFMIRAGAIVGGELFAECVLPSGTPTGSGALMGFGLSELGLAVCSQLEQSRQRKRLRVEACVVRSDP